MRPYRIRLLGACLLLSLACALPAVAATTTIGSLHCNDADGAPLTKGQTVTITGVVVGQFSVDRSVKLYVEDATGGVNVFGSPKNCVPLGDSVRVTGVVTGFNGLTEITGSAETPIAIDSLGHAAVVPAPLQLTLDQLNATEQPGGCEPNESRLVQLDNVRILSAKGEALPDTARFADNTNYRLVTSAADTNYVMMRVNDATGCGLSGSLVGQPVPAGVPLRVDGVISQYMGRGRTHGGYQLLPRGRDDIRRMVVKPVRVPVKH